MAPPSIISVPDASFDLSRATSKKSLLGTRKRSKAPKEITLSLVELERSIGEGTIETRDSHEEC